MYRYIRQAEIGVPDSQIESGADLKHDVAKTHDNLCWLYERFILCFGATAVTLYSADLLNLRRIGIFLFLIRMLRIGLDSLAQTV